ncbi:extracellular solute-binding protein [Bradyrhizobium sp.]|uniref:extracellular solute-binding protein n=1 Tax=Bradyrhizobium sp. TaxID=376 RepID=UPI002D3C8093|nr:extracellular solute-binding protein [Bradyrhizobium sp.]HZR76180.1 extracellular solute-binding protein [Bradyrhizobium sp.]
MTFRLSQCAALGAFLLVHAMPIASAAPRVVVYTSVDDVFARPIAELFTKKTGIEVQLVPDTEETKSTGLLNRLIAEKNRPQADVFWSGDPVRAQVLKLKGVATAYQSPNAAELPKAYGDPEGYWTGFSARVRVILYNTTLIANEHAPKSIFDLANDPTLRGRVCIANPLFGTTSMHAAALFVALGDQQARDYFEGLTRNGVKMVSSNGEVRRRVGEGDCAAGIADSDDANEVVKDKKPVGIVYPDENGIGTLIVPNATVLIAHGPDLENGKRFIDFLLTPETERALADSDAAQIPLLPNVPTPPQMRAIGQLHPMHVDYGKLALKLDDLSRGYLREWAAKNSR